jgi:enoyl-CoA hydratase/carnithine racemase
MNSLVLVERESDTWIVTLNRPDKLNAMSADLVDQLQDAVNCANKEGARLIVFKGSGKSFCSGFDLSDFENSSEADLLMRFVRIELLLQSISNSSALTLALAHGRVFGAGVDLFAACKQRVATQDSIFRMPGLKFGLVLGTRRFGEIVGNEKARELLEVTSSFNCEQAVSIGFVHKTLLMEEWPNYIESAKNCASQLDSVTQTVLYSILGGNSVKNDADLSNLVRSAVRNGLKERLRAYVKGN